jgi:hypothetical protein
MARTSTTPPLTAEERALLEQFRRATDDGRAEIAREAAHQVREAARQARPRCPCDGERGGEYIILKGKCGHCKKNPRDCRCEEIIRWCRCDLCRETRWVHLGLRVDL